MKAIQLGVLFIFGMATSVCRLSAQSTVLPLDEASTLPSQYPVGAYMMGSESDAPYSWRYDAGVVFGFKPAHTYYRHVQFVANHNGSSLALRSKDGSNDSWGSWRNLVLSNASGKVGIGTLAPDADLEIKSNSTSAELHIDAGGASGHPLIRLQKGGVNKWGWIGEYPDAGKMSFFNYSGSGPVMVIQDNGNVGIGTTSPGNKLEVNGTIRSKEVIVESTGWPDYVFKDGYDFPSLAEVESHIEENGHLPGVEPASAVNEGGQSLGAMQRQMMQKLEELTLYLIDQQGQIDELKRQNDELKRNFHKMGGSHE